MGDDRPLTEREMLEQEYEALHGALPPDYRHVRQVVLSHCEWPRHVRDAAAAAAPAGPEDGRPGPASREECEACLRRNLCGRARRTSGADVRALCERLTATRRPDLTEDEQTPAALSAWARELAEVMLRRELLAHVHALDRPRAALCLSGGGIRSATFALGVLQGLAKRGLLGSFDYLSTVSGGGYIGGWLSAWVHRDPRGVDGVTRQLRASLGAAPNARGKRGDAPSVEEDSEPVACSNPEPPQVQHLRDYGNYLTPRLGLFRADTWTLVATYLRNLFLNWLILMPLMGAVLLLPRLYWILTMSMKEQPREGWWYGALVALCVSSSIVGVVSAFVSLPSLSRPPSARPLAIEPGFAVTQRARQRRRRPGTAAVLTLVLASMVLASVTASFVRAWFAPRGASIAGMVGMMAWCAGIYAASAVLICVVARRREKPNPPAFGRLALSLVCAGLVVGLVNYLISLDPASWLARPTALPGQVTATLRPYVYVTFLVPVFLVMYLLLVTLYVGLTSEAPGGDDDREWWARVMGWLLMVAFGWVVLFGVSLFAPQLLAIQWQFGGTLTAITAVASTLGLLGAGSPSSGAGEGPQRPTWYRAALARVPGLAAGMALLGLFILMSVGLELLLRAVTGQVGEPPSGPFRELSHDGAMTARLFCLLLLTTIAFGKRINSNRLSLHAVYRDRLIRAFLGASNADRRADPFTGFAPEDNLPMHHLRRHRAFTEQELSGSVAGVPRVVGVAQLLHDRPRPVLQYMWEAAAPYLGPINTERLRAAHDGGAMREHAVAEAVEKALNVALSDPQLVWRSRFKEAAEREAPGCEAINQAFKRLEHDECPELLNRLILEEELYLELPEGPRPGAAGDGRMRRVHLLRPQAGEASVPRPLHVVNVALNLVDGRRLAWQQRKATSFTVSPLHSGYSEGYRPSVEYGGAITLGTAVTISGAAVSPNMGYHSSPVVTFLMTLFNVRLGWWLGNPARVAPGLWRRLARRAGFTVSRGAAAAPSYELSGPDHSVRPLLDEALGRTSELSQYVYLSDGGHFDNLGIYEMVRRRCRYIVVSDASCDPECTFEDLANAIRKVQIDMGVPISIKEILRPPGPDGAHRGRSCAVGEIDYAAVDGPDAEAGTLIYLKPARREAAPVDLYSHGRTSRDFPHEPTADQWFSESQFESYRKLGYVTVESVCAGHERGGAAVTSLAEFVAAARRQATPGPRRGPRHGTGDVEGPRAA